MAGQKSNIQKTLVVDLDGTLIKTDILYESLIAYIKANYLNIFRLLPRLIEGKATLKRFLALNTELKPELLPYNQDVTDYILKHKKSGGRVALVTASDEFVAQSIGAHLGLFDTVFGSNGQVNLKGSVKAEFLSKEFGNANYIYIGDAAADLASWKNSSKAVTVNISNGLRQKVDALQVEKLHIKTGSKTFSPYLTALRPHQWLKNILVFLPALAGHKFDAHILVTSAIAFGLMSLVASSVYIINDIIDLDADRAHPRKSLRPFASGNANVVVGLVFSALMIAISFGIATYYSKIFAAVLAAYFLTTCIYSLFLKKIIIVDVCVLAALYTIRIVAGAAITGIALSSWLLSFAAFFFFSLAAVKRQVELLDHGDRSKTVVRGRGYLSSDANTLGTMAISAGYVSVLILALYISSEDVLQLYAHPEYLWGVCLAVFFWLNRVYILTHRRLMNDDPVFFAATDRVSLALFGIILAVLLFGASS